MIRMGGRRHGRALGALGVAFAMVLFSTAEPALAKGLANTAGPPTSTHAVQPVYTSGNITSCPSGTTTFINTSDLGPGDQSATYSKGGTTFQATVDSTGTFISFMTNSPSFTVYVKGGPAYDTYNYTGTTISPAYPSDTGLHSPYNNGGNIATISHYLVCGQPAVAKVTPTLTTTPSSGGTVGSAVLNDTATLSGGTSPGGSITFDLYSPSETSCSGTPAFSQTVTVSGNGSYSTGNTMAAGVVGTWNWTAIYSGDANNFGASSACGPEKVTVAQATVGLTTQPTPGGAAGTVVLNDAATVANGFEPGGAITFNLYSPSESSCSGTPVYSQTVTVSGDGTYMTDNTTAVPSSMNGTWNWTASYSGDANNVAASSTCGQEMVTVTAPVPQGSCEGSGSISTLVSGTNVVSYVPKGNWESGATGIDVVNVEGSSVTNTLIPTGTDVINSCASNSVTGQTVCTANNNDVYVLKGAGLDPSVSPNPLTDAGTGTIGFSGGFATTTGVSMDATDNKALLGISIGGVGGFQFLDLATDTFEAPFATEDPGQRISGRSAYRPRSPPHPVGC